MSYADTSALIKILLPEAESVALASHLSTATDRTTSSALTIAELTRVVTRSGGAATDARMLVQQLDLLELDESLLWRAGRLPAAAGTFLRAADAIHVVSAMKLDETMFITYDRRQAQAAAERGFTVISPGRPDDWYQRAGVRTRPGPLHGAEVAGAGE